MHKLTKPNRPSVVCLFVAWAVFAAGPRPIVHSHEEFGDQITDASEAFAKHLALYHAEPAAESRCDWHLHWVFNPVTGMVGQDGVLSLPLVQTPAFESSNALFGFDMGTRSKSPSLDGWCASESGAQASFLYRQKLSHRGFHTASSSRISLLEILCVCRC